MPGVNGTPYQLMGATAVRRSDPTAAEASDTSEESADEQRCDY